MKKTTIATTVYPIIPIFLTFMFANGTPIKPIRERTPLIIITIRSVFSKLLDLKTGAAKSIESAKNQSQANISKVYITDGHLKEKNNDAQEKPATSI